jgi:integrase
MAEATFVLKEPTSKEPTLIYLMFRFNGQRLKYSTGLKIKFKYWNFSTQFAKETREFPGYAEFNALLKNLSSAVSNQYRKLINDSIAPTIENLRPALDEVLFRNNKKEKKDLIGFIEELISTSSFKPNTIKQYKTALRQLKDYQSDRRKKIDFSDINLDFYNDFYKFLISRDCSVNYIGTIVKNIKVFMSEAVERGFTDNLQFKSKRFKVVEENTDAIYLTIDDINKLQKLDLSAKPRLDKVRDLFLIGCHTGLRFSDLVQLSDENIIQNKTQAKVRTEKTGEVVIIPLNATVRKILHKYNGITPQIISNQKMNEYLKEIGLLAELNEPTLLTFTKGGQKQNETYKKYELVTVHTARRSFATNAYLAGVPTISIMKITGHRTEKAFMRYIKISHEDNANKLVNHPFFK